MCLQFQEAIMSRNFWRHCFRYGMRPEEWVLASARGKLALYFNNHNVMPSCFIIKCIPEMLPTDWMCYVLSQHIMWYITGRKCGTTWVRLVYSQGSLVNNVCPRGLGSDTCSGLIKILAVSNQGWLTHGLCPHEAPTWPLFCQNTGFPT